MSRCSRYAAPLLKKANGTFLLHYGIEVCDGEIVNEFEMKEELPNTIWLNGLIEEADEGGVLTACLLSPYDCINRQPVYGTQRTPLK